MEFGLTDIHYVVGDVAGGQLIKHRAMAPESIVVDRDVLTCGPLTPIGDFAEWVALREVFWRAACAPADPPPQPGPAWVYEQLVADRDRFEIAERILLWTGMTLSEYVATGWLIAAFRHLGLDVTRFKLVSLEVFRSQSMPLPTLAWFDAEQICGIDAWRSLGPADLAPFERLWNAVCGSSPEALIAFAASEANVPTPLKRAALSYLRRYPMAEHGLPHLDRLLLDQCRDRMLKAARIVGLTMSANPSDPDRPRDLYLFHRLKRIGAAAMPHPLVEIAGTGASMRSTEVRLTDAGERVIAGNANAIALNGLDDWVGGVRLNAAAGNIWLFDGTTLVPGDADGGVHAD